MTDEHMRQRLAEKLWRREGGACVSFLVSTLAGAFGEGAGGGDLQEMTSQAFELASPVFDYEGAAEDAGFEYCAEGGDDWAPYWAKDGRTFDTAEEACASENIDPYDHEVFEHWIVSDWLADRLTAKGEKCDKDFAGLTVWARTTTGQGIACDHVMQEIACDLWPSAQDRERVLA